MPLNLYRRHRRECKANHSEESRSGEFEERQKGWKRCACPIFASGVLGRKFKRKNTDVFSWDAAKSIAASWEAAGSWSGEVSPVPDAPPAPEPTIAKEVTIERAVKAFLEEHSRQAMNTRRKYNYLLGKLLRYSKEKGYVGIKRWEPIDVREFRNSWNISTKSAGNDMTTIRSFFEFCLSNEWIDRNPARMVKAPPRELAAEAERQERIPFSDEELQRMYDACETQYGKQPITWSRKVHHRPAEPGDTVNYRFKWTGQDLADFISVSVYTGLRISDVVNLDVDRLKASGELHVRTTKNGRKVYTWIPEWLQQRIRERAKEYGSLIFGDHQTPDTNVWSDVWRRKLKRLWKLCGPWPEKPTPHRFRHTFARILLQRPGVEVRDIAELLGDTEEMIRRHYSRWVPERQERLTAVLRDAFSEKPKPSVLVMKK